MPYLIFYLDRSNFLVGMLADYMKVGNFLIRILLLQN